MTRRRSPAIAAPDGTALASTLSPGDTVLVPVALAIRTDTCWLARPVCGPVRGEPVVRVDLDAVVPVVARYQPAAVATGEVADPLAGVRR